MAPPRKDNIPLTLRVSQDLLKLLDDRRREEEDIPTRPEMVRRILQDYFDKGR
ncbi:ribbon-helix-helix protein, CopG family [Martelella mediterranea]|uniref:Ribbon-helix-helix CopG family protein n=1 Tax=Martelella mediterranea TaxID=293089 RepID=A0A4R3NFW3_9HYPH|nr:ribbon-helix-helix protein, CopG family [Martelella mediterranea]TCT30112.1 ribbon-helix-helix CopG family protein [Martelella mediterranea]